MVDLGHRPQAWSAGLHHQPSERHSPRVDLPASGPIPVGGLLRAARALADCSQRSLGSRSGIPKSVISRMELDDTGQRTSIAAFVGALGVCGFTVTIHADGRRLRPDDDPERDRGDRRYPPHLEPHALERETDWWGFTRMHWLVPRVIELPSRVYHVSPWWRERWRERQPHPWWARFWEDSAHLAPPHQVHPSLERRRREERRRQEWIESWKRTTGRTSGSELPGPTPGSGASDCGPNQTSGHVAEPEPGAGEGLREQ